MELSQFTQNELGLLLGKNINKIRQKKFRYFFLYIISLLYLSIPSFQVPVIEYNTFRFTSLMDQRAVQNFMLFYPKQAWAGINEVNPNLLKCIVSMEDGSFFSHKGIDWDELNKSLKTNKRRGRSVRGGSTITMQLAKNLYLSTDKSIIRKAKEFVITFRMEKELSKKGILRNYINAVEWGKGIFGIREAAEEYFKKEPSELTTNECARLAAVIPSPLEHAPNVRSRYVSFRSSIILGRYSDIVLFPEF